MESEVKDQNTEKKPRRGSQDEAEAGKNNNQTTPRRSPRLSQSEENIEPEKTDADQPEKMVTEEKPEDEVSGEDDDSISEDKRKETMESLLMKIGSPKDFNPTTLSTLLALVSGR
jgi:hypothetical protein